MTIKVQAPNGAIIEFPDGTPPETMAQAMRNAFGGPEQQQAPDPVRARAEAMANQIEQTGGQMGAGGLFRNAFSLGLNDKVTGLTEGVANLFRGGSFGEGYSAGSLAEQIVEQRARERSGARGTAAEIAGTLATGALAKAPAAATAMGRILQAGREAGTLGALQGAGDSTQGNVGGVVGDALVGGGLGAGLGAGFSGVMEAARPLYRGGKAIYNGIRGLADNVDERAANRVYQALSADQMTPQKAAGRMTRGNANLMGVADENTLGLARAASARPGPGRTMLNRALDSQQKASAGKVTRLVNDALGGANETFNTRLAGMIKDRGAKARDVYEKAFARNFGGSHSMAFDDLAQRVPAEAVRNAQRVAKAEGRPFGEQLIASIDDATGLVTFSRSPSLREWHYIQRGLRAAADNAYRQGVGEVGTAYKALHRDILDAMDGANPLYKMARKSYATESQMIDALNMGRDIMKPGQLNNIDALAETFKGMSKGEKEMVRTGLARGLEDMVQSTPSEAGDVVRKIFGTPQKRAAIRAIFDNDSKFRAFEFKMGQMAKNAKAFKYVRTGSRTSFVDAEKEAAGVANDLANTVVDVARGGYASATMRGLSKLIGNRTGMSDDVAQRVAQILTSEDPNFVLSVLSKPKNRAASAAIQSKLDARISALIRAGSLGTAAGIGSSAVQGR